MPSTLITNIKSLLQVHEVSPSPIKGKAMDNLPSIDNAFLLLEGEYIKDYGKMNDAPAQADIVIDAQGKTVLPAWCDSHTHLVYAGSREGEFVDRIKGLSYQEIANKGGGILNSAKRLQVTSEEKLLEAAYQRLQEVQGFGTGAIEIKSGYGLTTEAELKILRVIKQLKAMTDIEIKATFLGAHAVPLAYKSDRAAYIKLILEDMLPKIAAEGLADYIDVFCEKVAFSPEETARIIEAGKNYNLPAKIHTNQFYSLGGIHTAVRLGAKSVDHLEVVNDEEIKILLDSNTMPCLLPSAPFFINDHYPPARKLIDAGLPVALASDYNPGTTPSGKMAFVLSLACIKMKMSPAETINAATINAAHAMDLEDTHGTITRGKFANIIITKPISSLAFIPYAFGSDLIDQVIYKGKKYTRDVMS